MVTHFESIWEIDLMQCVMTAPKLHLDVTPQNTIMVEVRIFSSDAILRAAAFYARRGVRFNPACADLQRQCAYECLYMTPA